MSIMVNETVSYEEGQRSLSSSICALTKATERLRTTEGLQGLPPQPRRFNLIKPSTKRFVI